MSDFQNQMNRVVAGFVSQITELARRAAIDTLETALNGRAAPRRGASAAGPAPAASRSRGRGAKRSSDELDKLAENFLAFVTEHPGLRIEQINKELGTSTKDLALPIRKLLADGTVHAKGHKRSTTYFPGGGGSGGGRKRKSKN